MEETHAAQYIFSPENPIYHFARNDRVTLCGLWLHGDPNQRRRKDDRRLVAEKPTGQFVALCSRVIARLMACPNLNVLPSIYFHAFHTSKSYPKKHGSVLI
jgi:hypothetical protein